MKWNTFLLYIAWGFSLLRFSLIQCFTYEHSKCQHDSYTQIHQMMHSVKKFCDPHQSAGPITQKCSSGFYREKTGPHRDQCVPCSCNGLSEECDEQTGHCMNCQFNTTGDHCERCKEGYYGNAAIKTCRPCPCPFTQKNFALACLEIKAGVVECLCKKGYSGARCGRCAYGYYGDPMRQGDICKPCPCAGRCDHLTGECIRCENSSCNGDCHERDRCVRSLVVDLNEMDVGFNWTQQNITRGHAFSSLKHLQANTNKTQVQVDRRTAAVRHLDLKVEQLEADVIAVKNDLSQLTNETLHTTSNVEFWQNVNGSKSQAQKLLFEAEGLLGAVQDLAKQQTHVKPEDPNSFSEKDKSEMMAKAQPIMQEIRVRRCATQRNKADNSQAGADQLLNSIRNMSIPAKTFQTFRNSLTASDVSLREIAQLLLCAENAVNRTKDLNRKSLTALLPLQKALTQLEIEQQVLHFLSKFEEIKKEFGKYPAQMDGARLELTKKLQKVLEMAKVDNVAEAEEHAEQLNNLASKLHYKLNNLTDSFEQLRILGVGGYKNIIKALQTAESTANQSGEASFQALKVTEEGGLVISVEEMKHNSSNLDSEVDGTRRHFEMLSRLTHSLKKRMKKQKKKGESQRRDISTTGDDIKQIKSGTAGLLIQSAKTASSAANSSVCHLKERLGNISTNVENLTSSTIYLNINKVLTDAKQALKSFNRELPVLNNKLVQMKARGEKKAFSANITENIMRIKDIINETRNFVNRISAATTFNGKGHIELHPPKNLEDIKTFTAVDLSLNRHHIKPPRMDLRRKRRLHRDGENNFFVFYLGNKNASGDYIGMAIRNTKLICVYKLGGTIHEMKTSQITITNVDSSDFDRVYFRRVYQDAEVSIIHNYTSAKSISVLSVRNLPNTLHGVCNLDAENVVFYVGGFPRDFTPPEELRYPSYRGAIKLLYINNNPVSLFNYKHASNSNVKQPAVKIPQSEVSNYYEGTGFRMAFIKNPERKKRRLIKFHINSSETSALLFYMGNKESFFCVSVERGHLVLQSQQGDRQTQVQSPDRVSLSDKQFAIIITDRFVVHYGSKKISMDFTKSSYTRFYIGGLPLELRQRCNITAAPLRGCLDHLTADGEIVEYNQTIGVGVGCPVSMLGVRIATLFSPLAMDSLFVWNETLRRISLSFRSKSRHAVLLKGSSEDFQLSLADGFVALKSYNCSVRSDKRYNDGVWHYLSAEWMPSGVELSIDNVNLMLTKFALTRKQDGNFTVCVANIYARRPGHVLPPADLGPLSLTADVFPGQCLHRIPSPTKLSAESALEPQNLQPIQTPASSQCRHQQTQHEYQFSEENSWISYTLPQQDLDFRPHFSLHFKTKTSKGLILLVEGRGVVPLLALYIANGKIKMSLGLNRTIQHKQKSNDGNWHKVELSIEKSTFHLLVDGVRVTDGRLPNDEGSSLNFHNPVYLGGDPNGLITKEQYIPKNSIIGCVRDFKMNNVFVSEPDSRRNILPCFDGRAEKGTFFGGGYIVLDNFFMFGSHFELSFEFRPQLLRGLLFHLQSHKISLNVYLMENEVGVRMNDGNGAVSVAVKAKKNLCDGKFHSVQVSKHDAMIKLMVDLISEEKENFFTSSFNSTRHSLYVGGVTNQHLTPVSTPFIGCMRNVKFNKKFVALDVDSLVVGPVSINKCPVEL